MPRIVAVVLSLGLVSGVYVKTTVVEDAAFEPPAAKVRPSVIAVSPEPAMSQIVTARAREDRPRAATASPSPWAHGRKQFECAATGTTRATYVGVTKEEVRLGAVVSESGILAASYGDARSAMEAVRNKINRMGGICGRKLNITYMEAGGDRDRGAAFACKLAKDVFALAVMPSPEALSGALESGCIDREGIPVVGTFGLVSGEFTHPWVWPVGVSGAAYGNAMASDAYQGGAREFGVIYEDYPDELREAAFAYSAEVKRRTGSSVRGYNANSSCTKHFCRLGRGQAGYSREVVEYTADPVDATALALTPQTALTLMSDPNMPSAREARYDATVSLLSRRFAVNCQDKCDGMRVWGPYDLYVDEAKKNPGVQTYVQDMQRTNPQVDIFNVFTQHAYVGMTVLADALARAGVDLTRTTLANALDTNTFETGMSKPIRFGAPPRRRGNQCVHAYQIHYKGTFAGWKRVSDWLCA